MQSKVLSSAILSAAILGASAAAPAAVPDVPTPLRPPAGEVMFVEALASGVQIYECTAKPGDPAAHQWAFRAPEAALSDRAGYRIGRHFAGPTWEAADGSRAVGAAEASAASPQPGAIPWLLLGVKSTSGSGVFAQATHVQRLDTAGGAAPAEPCTAANLGQVARVPYTATYVFYKKG